MIIRDLNGEPNKLSIFIQNDGDIQVTIFRDTGNYKDSIILGVRVGSATSGGSVPPPIFRLLRQLAEEFEKYRECKNEVDAYNKWNKEENPL